MRDSVHISAGELRHPVTVVLPVASTQNAFGEYTSTDTTPIDNGKSFVAWAKVEQLTGKAMELARLAGLKSQYRFVMRYNPLITEKCRLLFDGRRYTIDRLDNMLFRNIRFELYASDYIESPGTYQAPTT